MIQDMSTVRITESELARDVHGVLEKVQQGVEVIVEQNHRPVAVIRLPKKAGRPISECIAAAKAYEEKLGYRPIPDPDFAKDVEDGIRERGQPFNPPSWD
jgi:antitoxin (DNA-binding transcriptional repressor) of toxin-antitoxin stability system